MVIPGHVGSTLLALSPIAPGPIRYSSFLVIDGLRQKFHKTPKNAKIEL